jgi:hypothetical protein
MTKPQVRTYLRIIGFKSIVDDEGTMYMADKFTADCSKKGGGPPVALMKSILSDYIKSHPVNTTVIQQIMSDKKYELLYTPPYESWIQPIELIWARIKHTVATQSRKGRTHQLTALQTKTALSNITPTLTTNIVQHTEKLMDKWLLTDEAGSLRINFGSLERIKSANLYQLSKCTDLHLEEGNITGEAEEQYNSNGNDDNNDDG